jgi:hypothetical protein
VVFVRERRGTQAVVFERERFGTRVVFVRDVEFARQPG